MDRNLLKIIASMSGTVFRLIKSGGGIFRWGCSFFEVPAEEIVGKEAAKIIPVKTMAMTIVDLLSDNASEGIKIKRKLYASILKGKVFKYVG